MFASSETGNDDQVEQPHGYSNRVSASLRMRNSPQSGALVRRGLTLEARSAGSADVEQMLDDTYDSLRLSRSVRSRAPVSIERDLREYVERAEERTQAALDLNREALGLPIKSMENTQQARTQAIRARQRFEDLLSVSSRHRERVRLIQRTENESIAHITRQARDQHHRQADYEHQLEEQCSHS